MATELALRLSRGQLCIPSHQTTNINDFCTDDPDPSRLYAAMLKLLEKFSNPRI